ALQGTQLAVEKNFFREKTTETLFTTMDALRAEQMALIQKKLQLAPPLYGFEEAFNDALLLFNAGTVISALERMAAQAGRNNIDAKDENEEATNARVEATLSPVTKTTLTKKERLSDAVKDLASNPLDVGRLTTIKAILTKKE